MLQPVPNKKLRTGYTTGACATACCKAALWMLIHQKSIHQAQIDLPAKKNVVFQLADCKYNSTIASCTTIKDAGDDPDITHGATIGCEVSFNASQDVQFLRGAGVGVVKLAGLALKIGEPAINPVPRQMMLAETKALLQQYQIMAGVDIKVFIVDGERLAKKTLNSRVGIYGGLSVLGTTGIVEPFSAKSYIASIEQGIDVAVVNGVLELVLTPGAQSERHLQKLKPTLPNFAFVQFGNWIEEALNKIQSTQIRKVTLGMQLGKAIKLSAGLKNTHSSQSVWDPDWVIQLAKNADYASSKCTQIKQIHLARRLFEIFTFEEDANFFNQVCKACAENCSPAMSGKTFEMILLDPQGKVFQYTQ